MPASYCPSLFQTNEQITKLSTIAEVESRYEQEEAQNSSLDPEILHGSSQSSASMLIEPLLEKNQ